MASKVRSHRGSSSCLWVQSRGWYPKTKRQASACATSRERTVSNLSLQQKPLQTDVSISRLMPNATYPGRFKAAQVCLARRVVARRLARGTTSRANALCETRTQGRRRHRRGKRADQKRRNSEHVGLQRQSKRGPSLEHTLAAAYIPSPNTKNAGRSNGSARARAAEARCVDSSHTEGASLSDGATRSGG